MTLDRRALLRGCGLGVAASVTAGCAGFVGGDHGAGKGGGIHVAWWGDADRAALYRKALKMFASAHNAVGITSEYADLDPYLQRLATEAAAGGLPDVLWMRDTHVGRYGAAGSLLDLKKYINKGIDIADLGGTAAADGTVGRGVFALPTHYVGQAVITNADLLRRYQLSYPDSPTWDNVAELGRAVVDGSNGKLWGCNDPTLGSTQRHFEAYVRQSGAELFTHSGGLGFTKSLFGDWLEYWRKLRKDRVIPPADMELQSENSSDQNLLVTEKAGFLWESSNHLTSWQVLMKPKLQMFSMPEIADGSSTWWFFPPILISVAARTGKPDMCAAMVDFFLNDEPAAKVTRANQGAPSSARLRQDLLPLLAATDAAFVRQISREMTKSRRPLPVRPKGADQVNDALGRASQQVAYGKQGISEAVASFFTEVKRYL